MMVRTSFPTPQSSRFYAVLLLVIAVLLVPPCQAIHFTNNEWGVVPGQLFRLTWADSVKWATIKLMKGRPEDSEEGSEDLIIFETPELEYYWRVPTGKPEGDYFLVIYDLPGNTGYSPIFRIPPSPSPVLTEEAPTGTGTSPTSLTPTPQSTNPSQPPKSLSPTASAADMSAKTKAGMAIGAIIGIMALLAGVSYFFYYRGKKAGASRQQDKRRLKGNRLHSSDGSHLEEAITRFRPPSSTPRELCGKDRLPPELGSESLPTEIGTDWPVVAELSAGQLCIEEMELERQCRGDVKLDSRRVSMNLDSPGATDMEKPAVVSPLTPSDSDTCVDMKGNEKCLKNLDVGLDDKRVTKTREIQVQLKDDDSVNKDK